MKKVKIHKNALLTHSSGPFFGANSNSKISANVDGAYASKDKMVRVWPTFKKK